MLRNRIQMQYKKLYLSNRKSKQWTCAMIMLAERYCKTCMFLSLFTSHHDIYMYIQETLFNSFIINSDFNLFSLTNYLVRMMQTVSRQRSKNIQKSKHWNFKDRNIHKLITCLFEHVTEQNHATQLSQ